MKIPHQYQLFTAESSRELDRRTIQDFGIDGFTLMEIAGTRAADFILSYIDKGDKGLICCGRGNNAGDALVVARILVEHGVHIDLHWVDGVDALSPDTEKNYQLLKKLHSGLIQEILLDQKDINQYSFIVDGMLGTGLNSDVQSPYKEVIETINESTATIFAMDIPTGLHADNGVIMGTAVQADFTLAFGSLKIGYYQNSAYEVCGDIIFCELPFPSTLKNSSDFLLDENWVNNLTTDKKPRLHKYDGGVVYVLAGSEGLTGAAILASLSAWNTGVGAVVLITPKGLLSAYEEHLVHIIKKPVGDNSDTRFHIKHLDEVMRILNEKPGVLLIGPGLGREAQTLQFAEAIGNQFQGEMVIDADALLAFSNSDFESKHSESTRIYTPHVGELNFFDSDNELNRLEKAKKISGKLNAEVVSKGLPTIIASPNGETISTAYDTRIFARAGFGDVLAGKIAGYFLLTKDPKVGIVSALMDGYKKAGTMFETTGNLPEPMDII